MYIVYCIFYIVYGRFLMLRLNLSIFLGTSASICPGRGWVSPTRSFLSFSTTLITSTLVPPSILEPILVLVSTWTGLGGSRRGSLGVSIDSFLSISNWIPSGSSRFRRNFFAIDLRIDLFRFMPRFLRCSSRFCSLITHSRGSSFILTDGTRVRFD